MPLYTNDYLEYYLTLQSWIISNGIWNLLVNSGAIALPFLAVAAHETMRFTTA